MTSPSSRLRLDGTRRVPRRSRERRQAASQQLNVRDSPRDTVGVSRIEKEEQARARVEQEDNARARVEKEEYALSYDCVICGSFHALLLCVGRCVLLRLFWAVTSAAPFRYV